MLYAEEKVEIPGPPQSKDNFMEADGQFSLFQTIESKQNEILVAFSITCGNTIYYLEQNSEIIEEWIIREIVSLIEKGVKFSTINLKKQLYIIDAMFKKYGIELELDEYEKLFFDCTIAAYLLNPIGESYDFDDLGRDYLDTAFISWKDFLGKDTILLKKEKEYDNFIEYVCTNAYVADQVWEILLDKLEESNMSSLFWDVEMPLVYILYEMEQRGIRVNKQELKDYSEKLGVRIEALEKEIYKLAGEEFNINSPKQLGVILFEKLELPFAKKTKTGYSTSADILEKLKGEYEIVDKILEYRQLAKLKSTYADGLSNYINETDGRIHGKV